MREQLRLTKIDGEYHFNPNISEDEWIDILEDENITTENYKKWLLRFYEEPAHSATCKDIAQKYGATAQTVNSYIMNFGKAVDKALDRFEIYGTEGNRTYWIIPMNGKDMDNGLFLWTLRPELVQAISYLWGDKYLKLLNTYKQVLADNRKEAFDDERYKWELITHCEGKEPLEIVDLIRSTNIIDVARANSTLKYLIDNEKEVLNSSLKKLCDEATPLNERLGAFKKDMSALCGDKYRVQANDERTAAAILTCHNPQHYTLYKSSFYESFCEYLGRDTQVAGEKYTHYLEILRPLAELIATDKELGAFQAENLGDCVTSPLIMAQNIVYVMFEKGKLNKINDMNYWHIQMHLPNGKGGTEIDPIKMLGEREPIIGTGEWEDKQCSDFKTIPCGSIVMVRKGQAAIALCKITGENFTDAALSEKYINQNFRKVKILGWAKDYEQPRKQLFSQGTFSPCNSWTEQYEYIDKWYRHIQSQSKIARIAKILHQKKNIILQGAPGTGKTYNTAAVALSMIGENRIDYGNHKAVMKKYSELTEQKRIFFVTFHQSMDYEDFVEGIKPRISDKGMVTYEKEPGIFKQICEKAQESEEAKSHNFVLIIDEINRGNISRIFGELITLLEADKRLGEPDSRTVELPYSKQAFGVPQNLYIIGTMNTTDRSTGNIDYAVRRRFAFITLPADRDVINLRKGQELFDRVSEFVASHNTSDIDIDDLKVGHSYFMAKDEEELQIKMQYEVIPLLNEYVKDGILEVKDNEKEEFFDSLK